MSEMTKLLTKSVHFDRIPKSGGGDPDVFTKGGRKTTTKVKTSNLVNREVFLTIDVEYSIKEAKGNKTLLEKEDTFEIHAPIGYIITSFGKGKVHTDFSKTWEGKNHDWKDISKKKNVTDTFFSTLKIRFDGPGVVHEGNAQLKGTLSIPVTLKKQ